MDHYEENYDCEEMSAGSCRFSLCSNCARKNSEAGRKNECLEGHQLSPISVNTDGWDWGCWRCEGEKCGYVWRSNQDKDQDVVVWRCQHNNSKFLDCHYTGTTLMIKVPWGDWQADAEESDSEEESDS